MVTLVQKLLDGTLDPQQMRRCCSLTHLLRNTRISSVPPTCVGQTILRLNLRLGLSARPVSPLIPLIPKHLHDPKQPRNIFSSLSHSQNRMATLSCRPLCSQRVITNVPPPDPAPPARQVAEHWARGSRGNLLARQAHPPDTRAGRGGGSGGAGGDVSAADPTETGVPQCVAQHFPRTRAPKSSSGSVYLVLPVW